MAPVSQKQIHDDDDQDRGFDGGVRQPKLEMEILKTKRFSSPKSLRDLINAPSV